MSEVVTQEEADRRIAEALAINLPEAEAVDAVFAGHAEAATGHEVEQVDVPDSSQAPEPAAEPFCVVPATPGMLANNETPARNVNGVVQPGVQAMLTFQEGADLPSIIIGECCLEERDHCWTMYRLGENQQYLKSEVGEKPAFIEFRGKPVLRWSAHFNQWCIATRSSAAMGNDQGP